MAGSDDFGLYPTDYRTAGEFLGLLRQRVPGGVCTLDLRDRMAVFRWVHEENKAVVDVDHTVSLVELRESQGDLVHHADALSREWINQAELSGLELTPAVRRKGSG